MEVDRFVKNAVKWLLEEDNQDLLDSGDMKGLYKKWCEQPNTDLFSTAVARHDQLIHNLTRALELAGIDPLQNQTAIFDSMYNHSEIEEITIPDHIKRIGKEAFAYCAYLKKVNIGNGVETIEDYAFHCCGSLKAIDIPGNVKHINKGAFKSYVTHTALREVTLNEGLEDIGEGAFEDCAFKQIIIPTTVKFIGKDAFKSEYGYDNKKRVQYAGTIKQLSHINLSEDGIGADYIYCSDGRAVFDYGWRFEKKK